MANAWDGASRIWNLDEIGVYSSNEHCASCVVTKQEVVAFMLQISPLLGNGIPHDRMEYVARRPRQSRRNKAFSKARPGL